MADRVYEKGKINRIILCSDGVANLDVLHACDGRDVAGPSFLDLDPLESFEAIEPQHLGAH